MLKIVQKPAEHPNHGDRKGIKPGILVLHYTACTFPVAMAALQGPRATVSVDYVLDLDGTVYDILPDDRFGYHAGASIWRGQEGVNPRSVGIEIVNATGKTAYPEAQISALIELCRKILSETGILPENVVGHSDVAPKRKADPGPQFPWARLAAHGIGLFPPDDAPQTEPQSLAICQALLEQCGYPYPHAYGQTTAGNWVIVDPDHPRPDVPRFQRVGTEDLLKSFHRRFDPANAELGRPSRKTMAALHWLAGRQGAFNVADADADFEARLAVQDGGFYYRPSSRQPGAESLQRYLNRKLGISLVDDGKLGDKSSQAFHDAFGRYLKGDPRRAP